MTRSVTDPTDYDPEPEMSLIGYVLAVLNVLVMLPLLPFVGLLWLLDELITPGESEQPIGTRAEEGR